MLFERGGLLNKRLIMNKKWKTAISTALCSALFGGCLIGSVASANNGATPLKEAFSPIFRMAVCSDIHLTTTNSNLQKKFEKFFDTAYAYSENSTEYQTLDAVVVTGDLLHTPSAANMSLLQDSLYKKLKRETEFLGMIGNHDEEDLYASMIDYRLDKSIEVKGFHLIGLSLDASGNCTDAQLEWLNTELKEANEADVNKPIFTFQHFHIDNTVHGSEGSGGFGHSPSSAKLDAAYSEYSQVVNFSGHSHLAINSPRSIHQRDYTAVGVGTFKDTGVDKYDPVLSEYSTWTDSPKYSAAAASLYRIVEVDVNNRVRILTYDMNTQALAKSTSTTDSEEEVVEFIIEDVRDKSTFAYTDARFDSATAPFFKDSATLNFSEITATTAKVSFIQADDESCMYSYRVVCKDGSGKEITLDFLDDFYYNENNKDEALTISGLSASTQYTVSVYPINIWGKVGTAITGTLTTTA